MAAALGVPLAMGVALGIDRAFGEPPPSWHPVVGMGRYLAWAGRRMAGLPPRRAFAAGALGWLAGALPLVWLAWWIEQVLWRAAASFGPGPWPGIVAALLLGLLLKPMLAWRLLKREVLAVEEALAAGLAEGRQQVARLASRDTGRLSATQVRETAIETLAENLHDSVVAPLFWFALAGLPGAVLFRFANTADAMWGYRGAWEWAGKWAARADDLLAWLPARLTALALLPFGGRVLAAEARKTPSPNGGWPMAAMALALGVRLGKPGVYLLCAGAREVQPADVARAAVHAARALQVCVAVLALLAWALRSGSWV
jgi:adenosylcobinamide-phosphate synthase